MNCYHNPFWLATDTKTICRGINSVIRPSRVTPKLKHKVNYDSVTDSTVTASRFNNHFSNVAQVLNTKIPNFPDNTTAK